MPSWYPISKLYSSDESIPKNDIYCSICKAYRSVSLVANTELEVDYYRNTVSYCNIALKLTCGHIVADDCDPEAKFNLKAFKDEADWRHSVLSKPWED